MTIGADFISPGGSKAGHQDDQSGSKDAEKNSNFTNFLRPEDLKPGYVVELAGGRRYVVVLNHGRHELLACFGPQPATPINMFRWGASPAMTRIS